mmetsp:Transcript_5394/g.15799  ORF Transcript_5394/g.15799 Transcript_5394/m.15799 type:complete len:182 (-) Transcript_5394:2407-2952(-)
MTKKRNTRRQSSSHESKHVKATSRVGEHDDIISETTLLEKTIVDDKYISVRIPDHVFVSVAKKRCFLGAFEIQSENRSPRRGGVGFAARRKNTTTTTTTTEKRRKKRRRKEEGRDEENKAPRVIVGKEETLGKCPPRLPNDVSRTNTTKSNRIRKQPPPPRKKCSRFYETARVGIQTWRNY